MLLYRLFINPFPLSTRPESLGEGKGAGGGCFECRRDLALAALAKQSPRAFNVPMLTSRLRLRRDAVPPLSIGWPPG